MQKQNEDQVCLLDLPETLLDSILERLSPADLGKLSSVCTTLRIKISGSDYVWNKHMEQKWGGLVSHDAWKLNDSIMAYYKSIETGRLSFPAQVFGRGGYSLSCYDAQVSYDRHGDNFHARYPPEYRWPSEEELPWRRLRKPPTIDNYDTVDDLKPGDHIEIHWSDRKEGPFGWWYGVVGHLSSCSENNVSNCRCQYNDEMVLEFKQYAIGSFYRRVVLNRKGYRESGNPIDGYYGNVRRLVNDDEITRWRSFWPTDNGWFPWRD